MAEDNLGLRLAGAFLGAPLGPLGSMFGYGAAEDLAGAIPSFGKKEPRVGTVLSYLNGKPYKVFAGPWGTQSFETYQKLHYSDPKSFPRLSGTLPTSVTEPKTKKPSTAAAPVTAQDWERRTGAGATADENWPRPEPGAATDVTAGNVGEQMGKTPEDPVVERLLALQEQALTPEFSQERINQQLRQFAATVAITEAAGAEKAKQRLLRETQLAKINAWRDLAMNTNMANVLAQGMLGQALLVSQQPSAAMADVLGKGAAMAQQVLGAPTLR